MVLDDSCKISRLGSFRVVILGALVSFNQPKVNWQIHWTAANGSQIHHTTMRFLFFQCFETRRFHSHTIQFHDTQTKALWFAS